MFGLRVLLTVVFSWYLHLLIMCVNICHTREDKNVAGLVLGFRDCFGRIWKRTQTTQPLCGRYS